MRGAYGTQVQFDALSIFDATRAEPDATALVEAGAATSFAALAERAAAVCARLVTLGAAPSSQRPVALVASSERAALIVLHALIAMGVPALLVNPRLTERERRELVLLGRPVLYLDEEGCRALAAAPNAAEPAHSAPDPEQTLAVVFTSGSTGTPRGVLLSRRACLASADASAQNLGWVEGDRWLLGLSVAHVGGLGVVTRCLIARRAVVLPPPGPLDARALAGCIEGDRVTLLSLVPTQLARLLELEPAWRPPAHLRAILVGGAPAPAPLLDQARQRAIPVLTTYGLSEACSQVATQRPNTPCGAEQGAGHVLRGIDLRIAGGEIQLRSPALLSGYLGGEPVALTEDGWLRTGDYGTLDARGRLHVLGRAGDAIVTGGEKVHPLEVERVLEGFPGVAAACVYGVPDAAWGQLVAAAVVARAGASIDLDALSSWARQRLASFKRPRRLRVVTEIVSSAGGKPDRAAMAHADLESD